MFLGIFADFLGFPGIWNFSGSCRTAPVTCLPTVSQREKGNMKGCSLLLLLLLLHTCVISGFSMERELVVEAPDCKPGGTCGPTWVAAGSNLTKISRLTGIVDLTITGTGVLLDRALAGGLDLIEISPLTGIVDLPSNIEGISSPTDACLKPFSCKRPSLRNRRKMICCLPVNRRGRSRCPNSCD